MSAALIAIAALITLGALVSISTIGKPRKALTPGVAAVTTAISAVEVVVLVLAALR